MKTLTSRGFILALLLVGVAILPIIVVGLVALAAVMTRSVGTRLWFAPAAAHWQQFVQGSVIGWCPKADLEVYGQADDVLHFTTGADGWRGQAAMAEADASQFTGEFVMGFVYYGNDLWDYVPLNIGRYRKPFVRRVDRDEDWEVITEHVSPKPWPLDSVRIDNACLPEICSELTLAAQCRDAGGRLAVQDIHWRVSGHKKQVGRVRRDFHVRANS